MARYHISQLTQYMVRMEKGIRISLLHTAQAIFDGLKQEGEPVSYPVQWDSERQKRAYFATGGFGSGIPYQRTGAYVSSGEVHATPYGARMFKPHPAGAIAGTHNGWQSSIHIGRWPYMWDLVERELALLPKRIRDNVRIEEGELDASG